MSSEDRGHETNPAAPPGSIISERSAPHTLTRASIAWQGTTKLIEEKGVDDMLITLADCLKEHIQTGINERAIREQLGMYSDS